VSEVQFIPGGARGTRLLLSASNDSTVVVWDVHKARVAGRQSAPRRLGTTSDLHRGGVFSLDVHHGLAAQSGDVRVVSAWGQGSRSHP
jgi:hypothetical protein